MAEDESNDTPPSSIPESKRREIGITPAQRRLLGPARSRHDRPAPQRESETPVETPAAPRGFEMPRPGREAVEPEKAPADEERGSFAEEEEKPSGQRPAGQGIVPDRKAHTIAELHKGILIGAILILLGGTFYIGKKFDYVKYLLFSRTQPKLSDTSDNFGRLSSQELIAQGLAAQRLGRWHEAAERFIAAKRRNLKSRGLLYRAAKLCYDHGDFNSADSLFERAVAFDEHAELAYYFRGLIAVGRNDFSAAQHYFEAAANADPFTPGFYYYWAEALRRDHHSADAVARYEQAAQRADNEQDDAVCRFKVRMAQLEAGNAAQVAAEMEKKRAAGPLPVDWLMTEAALKVQAGQIAEGVEILQKARDADKSRLYSLFATCATDMLFNRAAENHPDLAQACQVSGAKP